MSGFCGWFDAVAARETTHTASGTDLPSLRQLLLRTVPSGARPQAIVETPQFSLIAWDAATYQRDNLFVVVDGHLSMRGEQGARSSANAAERLCAIYVKLGASAWPELLGSFAFAIFDLHAGKCLCAVDRMGGRPFSYSLASTGVFVFGSQATSVAAHPKIGARLNKQSILDYLFLHVVPAPQTIFAGVSKLPLAHELQLDNGRMSVRRYWSPKFQTAKTQSTDTLSEQLRSTLQAAVQRSVDRGGEASFLSGGLDSSTVSGLAARSSGKLRRVYTIGFAQHGYDESGYARIAADHFGLDLHLYYLTPNDVAASLPEIARAYDEPFGNSSAVPTLMCARNAAADGVKAMLAGDGGDELFAGNERYAKQKLFDYYARVPQWLRGSLIEPFAYGIAQRAPRTPLWKVYRYVDQAKQSAATRMVEVFGHLQGMAPEFIFHADLLRELDIDRPQRELMEYFDSAPAESNLDKMLYLDWKITLADNDLRKVNRMCELAGVAVHYPMLDDELVEMSTRIEPHLKLRGLRLREFYKQSFASFLPRAIIDKTKHGFGLPFGEWLKTDPRLHSITYAALNRTKERAIFRPEFIDHLLEAHRVGHASYYGSMVWSLLMLELWLQEHELSG